MNDGLITQTDRYYYVKRAKTKLQATQSSFVEAGVTVCFYYGGYDKSSGSTAETLSSAVPRDSWLRTTYMNHEPETEPERIEQNDRRRARVTVREDGTVTVPEQLLEEIDEPEFVAEDDGGEE